jgi:hypothetical protein
VLTEAEGWSVGASVLGMNRSFSRANPSVNEFGSSCPLRHQVAFRDLLRRPNAAKLVPLI